MKILNLVQGSDEWKRVKAKYFSASEAPIMMGCSSKATRNDLLRMKATCSEQEFSDWVKNVLFANGHAVEAAARPIAEKIIGEELYPATATDDDGYLLASFDGVTLLQDVVWECKQWNEKKAAEVRAGCVPDEDRWQVVQQLRVSGATKALYMVTDGTEEGTVHCWMVPSDEMEAKLMAGWAQFEADLTNYEHKEEAPQAVGRSPETLPALRIEVTGMVTASNLDEYRNKALALIGSVSTDLQTDQDFADAEKAVSWCKDVETRLEAAKEHALSQTESIDALFRTIDQIKEEARAKRLELDKLVKARKEAIRGEILHGAKQAVADHMRKLEKRIHPMRLPSYDADFAGAMKGKKTIKGLRDAVDQVIAQAKIDLSQMADEIEANMRAFEGLAGDQFRHLFPDLQQIITKESGDFAAVVKARVSEHKEAEAKRLEAERERIRQEEERKAQQAAASALEAERDRMARKQAEESAKNAAARQSLDNVQTKEVRNEDPAPYVSGPATLKLGDINDRLGFSVTADFIRDVLGIEPAETKGRAVLYREYDFTSICNALVLHIQDVQARRKAA